MVTKIKENIMFEQISTPGNSEDVIVEITADRQIELDAKEAKHEEWLVEQEVTKYQRDRIKGTYNIDASGNITQLTQGYPSMADQLDDIFHNGVDGWKATIQAVKDAHPKPV
jgi:hypothetical protein